MKKKIVIGISFIIFVLLAIYFATGFIKRTDVILNEYSLSEDGTKMILHVKVASSMGYVRAINVKKGSYISFYQTFGGLNFKLGAKNMYEIELDPYCTEIYFYKGDKGYRKVLQKNQETNEWEIVK